MAGVNVTVNGGGEINSFQSGRKTSSVRINTFCLLLVNSYAVFFLEYIP